MPKKFPQIYEMSEGAIDNFAVDATDWLNEGEQLTGTPTAVEVTTSDLTISAVAVNTKPVEQDNGEPDIAIGKAVVGQVEGQLEATAKYTVTVTASNDAADPRTFVGDMIIKVV